MDSRRPQRYYQRHQTPRHRGPHWPSIIAFSIIGLFVAVNAAVFAMYHDRTYPNAIVMNKPMGNVKFDELGATIGQTKLLPEAITLTHNRLNVSVSLADVAISQDTARTVASAREQQPWLPILGLFGKHELAAPIKQAEVPATAISKLESTFKGEPVNARLAMEGQDVVIKDGVYGFRFDKASLQSDIIKALDDGKASLSAPVRTSPPAIETASLEDDKRSVESQLNTSLTYNLQGTISKADRATIASWFVAEGDTFKPSADLIMGYLTKLAGAKNILIKDSTPAVTSTQRALADRQPLDLTLAPATALKTITYCTAVKGVDRAELATLSAKAASTYFDSRGWGMNGQVAFKEVTTGCDFTLWLAASNLMPSFGAICDSMWSCRVGPNVVINNDRWMNASPAWQKYGGTIPEYRSMVINHETGHWLGFGHDHCSGAGQQAPVMQQQSIDLQGCVFSPWPNASELTTNRTRLGI